MLFTLSIESKTVGAKELFHNLQLVIQPKQKVGVIGRNGVGKTTLFNILSGKDTDYTGSMQRKRGTQLISTAQEHHEVGSTSVVDYILHNLPEYRRLKHIINTYPETMGDNLRKIQTYTEALERFSALGYYHVEEDVLESLRSYQIPQGLAKGPLARLSGGQKRFVELVGVEHSNADIALIDEPTNHMDYVAKARFIEWLDHTRQAVLVITHDRDVLQHVDAIIELKNGRSHTFSGNYEAYLRQNLTATTTQLHDYRVALKTLETLHKKILWARARKPSWHGTADQRNPFEVMERRLQKEYDEIQKAHPKPTFWIDRESAQELAKDVGEHYEKFKSKNIRIQTVTTNKLHKELLSIENLSLGYDGTPLFKPLNFKLQPGERLRLVGRNGAGKTTLVRAIVAASTESTIPTRINGEIRCSGKLRLSVYEQEIQPDLLELTVAENIENIYHHLGQPITSETVKRVLSDYLFDPYQDASLKVAQLSGGQKARLQIIRMLANKPNLLILDEPTNHLDLPSIEELEDALANYAGAVLYVTHDSYFAKNVGGTELLLAQ